MKLIKVIRDHLYPAELEAYLELSPLEFVMIVGVFAVGIIASGLLLGGVA